MPPVIAAEDIPDLIGAGLYSRDRRHVERMATLEAVRPGVAGLSVFSALLGCVGGVALIAATMLPVVRVEDGIRIEAGQAIIVSRDLYYSDLIIGTPGGIDGKQLIAFAAAIGALSILLASFQCHAFQWLPTIFAWGLAFWCISGWRIPTLEIMAGAWVTLAAGLCLGLSTLGGSRRTSAGVLAAISLGTCWIPYLGGVTGLAGLVLSGSSLFDAVRGYHLARASADKRRIALALRLLYVPVLALTASFMGVLFSGVTLLLLLVLT